MIVLNLSSTTIMKVIQSWEIARQRQGFDEKLGIDTLLLLFKMDPMFKRIFGFEVDQVINPDGLHRMGILIHGQSIIQMLNTMFSVLGPDTDLLQIVLLDIGEKQCKLGLSPDHFRLLCRALLEVLAEVMGNDWTEDLKSAWFQVIRFLSFEISKVMQKRMAAKCDPILPPKSPSGGRRVRFTLGQKVSSDRKRQVAANAG